MRPRKRFGQHFLHDQSVLRAIHEAIGLRTSSHCVEIGPGTGALTEGLIAKRPALLTLIEIDRDLAARLRRRIEAVDCGFCRVIEADVLSINFIELASASDQRLQVVGNLPYNISTPLLFHLMGQRRVIDDQVFMLQKEVVDRVVAPLGSADYGRLSVMLQSCYQVWHLLDVPSMAFHPPPKVLSSVFRLRAIDHSAWPQPGLDFPQEQLEILLRTGFGQRRKMLRAHLLRWLQTQGVQPDEAQSMGFAPSARPQEVPVSAWCAMALRLSGCCAADYALRSISSTL
ncbi:MAG: 16S rRNA (adenine(1518)-N(6)/adenine(1519)-N(6))-dimethyltransferase RsmA [Betaproteobacteria bacterium]|nr:16S rRNA (adenine(1518)-N(6)/adenine(1519)-N(6))-dimethyltransferase RsmA [Pseudomonadota bacterium]NBO11949.1 16S rRNA (adenine(1518)-N(6)/adenine(1519)-N(6))-dimethyltransferase RsmA [Betaproteobacteria bacterium]NBO44033.1 16S rRNA (adenine(1518)-N(6)/adenine(1519)-N(6))-dimethyltransferase RsmA [Betaproteobacteria bacterium]NBP10010.1 16S rRNA (adenine(1518)-N(6)/adenine(1519)-N(6))-dimethyltransferase RsmA [Betaproteobacteria bacterium]NBP61332.1 16S rRNA (adenine(1518)-N(6)/adenine(151